MKIMLFTSKPQLFFNMKLLFCDLDGTLIYSHRHYYAGKHVWVENLNGHQQSFMTLDTYEYFRNQKWLHVIPLTTRNHIQFKRLNELINKLEIQESLICNGAVLLKGKHEDLTWRNESEQIIQPILPHLIQLKKVAESLAGTENTIYSEPFMFYVRSSHTNELYQRLCAITNFQKISVFQDARKVYCIPKVFDKSVAITRYCNRYGKKDIMAVGDSCFDISMLYAADIGFYPNALKKYIELKSNLHYCCDWFSDSLCKELEKVRIGEI